jgi:hypothetical protein
MSTFNTDFIVKNNLQVLGTGTTAISGSITATSFNSITGLASVAPLVASTSAAIGTSTLTARQDHIHPVFTLTIGNGLSGTSYNTTSAITIAVSAANNTTAASYFPVFATSQGTAVALGTVSTFTMNPSTGTLGASIVNVASGGSYQINGTSVLNATTLGSGITASSLTSVGTLGSVTVSGTSTLAAITTSSLIATNATAPTIASAATIAPTKMISFISGTTQITTITAPSPISSGGGVIVLIPTGAWTTGTSGNIAIATTAVVSKALFMTYDITTAKWYPSY